MLVSFGNILLHLRYFTCLLLLLSVTSGAQTLQGIVSDSATGKPLYPVTVVNTRTQAVTYTNEHGVYTIAANTGEVIAFSYVGYNTVTKQKPKAVIVASLNISLSQSAVQLQEYKIHSSSRTQYQIDSAERRTIYHSELSRKHPSPINSPFSAVAEKFNKKAKRTYKFQKEYEDRDLQRFIDTRYTPDLVESITNLTGDTLGYFMNSYPMPYDFARTASDLELKMWIRTNYKAWMKKEALVAE